MMWLTTINGERPQIVAAPYAHIAFQRRWRCVFLLASCASLIGYRKAKRTQYLLTEDTAEVRFRKNMEQPAMTLRVVPASSLLPDQIGE